MARLRHNVAWALAGTIGFAATQWLQVVALARFADARAVGVYGLGLAYAAPIILLTNLQLRTVLATDQRHTHPIESYLRLRVWSTAVAGLLMAGVILARQDDAETTSALALVAASKLVEAISDVCYGAFQGSERMSRVAASQLLRGVLGTIAFVAVLAVGGSLVGALALQLGVWIGVAFLHDLSAVRSPAATRGESAPRERLIPIVRAAWPLGVSVALISLSANVPRIVLEHTWSAAVLGVYVAVSYFHIAIGLASVSIGQAATPTLVRRWQSGHPGAFGGFVARLLAVCVVGTVVAIPVGLWAGEPILAAIFGARYAGHAELLTLVLVAAGGTSATNILNHAATATRSFAHFLVPNIATTLVTIACSILLIPRLGLIGAGWALVVTSWIGLVPPLVVIGRAVRASRRGAAHAD